MASVTLVVEGDTDVPFAQKVLRAAGLSAFNVVNKRGKTNLDPALVSYNSAAKFTGWFVLRDLDQDATCAPDLREQLLPEPARFMCFRIPVRAVESWAMGDSERLAKHLKVSEGKVPVSPEGEEDPKVSVVNLARKSTSPVVRRELVPAVGAGRKSGPGYEASLIEFGTEKWRWQQAQKRCPSLKRCIAALRKLKKELEAAGQ